MEAGDGSEAHEHEILGLVEDTVQGDPGIFEKQQTKEIPGYIMETS